MDTQLTFTKLRILRRLETNRLRRAQQSVRQAQSNCIKAEQALAKAQEKYIKLKDHYEATAVV